MKIPTCKMNIMKDFRFKSDFMKQVLPKFVSAAAVAYAIRLYFDC